MEHNVSLRRSSFVGVYWLNKIKKENLRLIPNALHKMSNDILFIYADKDPKL